MSKSLLFLPGAGADPNFWSPVAHLLPQEWHKVFLGWPGLGHNPPTRQVNGFQDLVRLAEEHLPPGESTIVAQSYGGAVALALCLIQPERVNSLVLCATAAGLNITRFGAQDWMPAYRAEYPEAASWLYDARPDFEPELPSIWQPTLLLWGDADPISPVAVGRHLQHCLPHATLRLVAGGTHAMATERAPEVASFIRQHVLSVGVRRETLG
jgi:pimeloyl-ACP methyl ester carboxylesterase